MAPPENLPPAWFGPSRQQSPSRRTESTSENTLSRMFATAYGRPRALRGETIPLNARVFAVADVFDALTSRRPYKGALDFEQAWALLEGGRGGQFDPRIVDAFAGFVPALFHAISGQEESGLEALLDRKLKRNFRF